MELIVQVFDQAVRVLGGSFVVKTSAAEEGLVPLPLEFGEVLGGAIDLLVEGIDGIFNGHGPLAGRLEPADVPEHRTGGIEFDELAVGRLDRGSKRREALQAADQQDRHDTDHDGQAEQQLVADAPAEGHAPTSLSAPYLAVLERQPNPSGPRTER